MQLPSILLPPADPAFDLMPKPVQLDQLPENDRARMIVKLCMLGSLAWDYADTVLSLAAKMNLSATRQASRAIRQLKRDYDRYRCGVLNDASLAMERRLAELFEDVNSEAFTRLCHGLDTEIGHIRQLDDDNVMLVKAVQMAMTVIDTMKLFAAESDRWMQANGINNRTALSPYFLRLAILLPVYAGDCYDPCSQSRRITARILLKEVNAIELYNENGKV